MSRTPFSPSLGRRLPSFVRRWPLRARNSSSEISLSRRRVGVALLLAAVSALRQLRRGSQFGVPCVQGSQAGGEGGAETAAETEAGEPRRTVERSVIGVSPDNTHSVSARGGGVARPYSEFLL